MKRLNKPDEPLSIRRRFVVRLDNLVHVKTSGIAEVFNGILLLLWGVWLFSVPNILEHSIHNDFFTTVPQWIWGTVALAIGGIQTLSTLFGETRMRKLAALPSVILWFLVTVSFLDAEPSSLNTPTYIMITIYNLWLNYRLNKAYYLDESVYEF